MSEPTKKVMQLQMHGLEVRLSDSNTEIRKMAIEIEQAEQKIARLQGELAKALARNPEIGYGYWTPDGTLSQGDGDSRVMLYETDNLRSEIIQAKRELAEYLEQVEAALAEVKEEYKRELHEITEEYKRGLYATREELAAVKADLAAAEEGNGECCDERENAEAALAERDTVIQAIASTLGLIHAPEIRPGELAAVVQQAVIQQKVALAEATRWKDAITDVAIVNWTLSEQTKDNPREIIADLIDEVIRDKQDLLDAAQAEAKALAVLAESHKVRRAKEQRDGPFNDEITQRIDALCAYIVRVEKAYDTALTREAKWKALAERLAAKCITRNPVRFPYRNTTFILTCLVCGSANGEEYPLEHEDGCPVALYAAAVAEEEKGNTPQ